MSIKKRVSLFLSGSFLTIALLAMSVLLKSETPIETVAEEVIEETIYDVPVEIVKPNSKSKLKRDYIKKHLKTAKQLGVGSLKDTNALNSLVVVNSLYEVKPDKGYIIGNMTHSYPYLTKDALLILRKIGASFYAASGDESYFTVSSLTRTEETQKKLRSRNSNAAKDESSHCYGVSFDISYIRYNGIREWDYERTKMLEGILAEMQNNDEIYVLKERKQSCFHISVR